MHRLPGGRKPRVYALKPELDAWLGMSSEESPSITSLSIAVLPFRSLSGEPGAHSFCDGLVENILAGLARVKGLNVAARSSSFAFRGQECDVREIGAALNAALLLEGSVQWSLDRVRISAQLVDAVTGFHLWTEIYDRRRDSPFEVQDDITRRIVAALTVKLSSGGPPPRAPVEEFTASAGA